MKRYYRNDNVFVMRMMVPRRHSIVATFLLLLLMSLVQSSKAAHLQHFTIAECSEKLINADWNSDNQLDRSEFVEALDLITDGGLYNNKNSSTDFTGLPGVLREAFNRLSCRCLRHGVSGTEVSCSCAGGNAAIDITGADNGSTITSAQIDLLIETCEVIDEALSDTNVFDRQDASPVPGITRQVTPMPPTPSPAQCAISMVVADRNPQDDVMNTAEYVIFINRLSPSSFGDSFAGLPQVLQDNFNNLTTTDGQINILGVQPGSTVPPTQDTFLDQICLDSGVAIMQALGVMGPPNIPTTPTTPQAPPTPQPVGGPPVNLTPRPTRPINQCYAGMLTNDSPSNRQLSQEEYASFVNFLEPGSFTGLTYVQLPVALQLNFKKLAPDGFIDTSGILNPNLTQEVFLQKVCDDTNSAINLALFPNISPSTEPPITTSPTPSPTPLAQTFPPTPLPTPFTTPVPRPPPSTPSAPTQSPTVTINPTAVSEDYEVVSQFVISNMNGISAAQLNQAGNQQRAEIDTSYASVVQTTIEGTIGRTAISKDHLRSQRGRRELEVSYSRGFTQYYVNRQCPFDAPFGSSCQDVVATFVIGISPDENAELIDSQAQIAVDTSIAAGDLQTLLIQQGSVIMVQEGANVDPPTATPSSSPSNSPSFVQPISDGFTAGEIVIESAFIISNTIGLTAGDLQPGSSNREILQDAYDTTAQGSVLDVGDDQVKFVVNSATITEIIDTDCTDRAPSAAVCQAATAQFRISGVDDIENERRSRQYTNAIDTSINEDLKNNLDAADPPQSPISVETAGGDPAKLPTVAPAPIPPTPSSDGGSGELNTGAIAGIAGGGAALFLLLCGGGLYFYSRRYARTKREPASKDEIDDSDVDSSEFGSRKDDRPYTDQNESESYDQYGSTLDDSEPKDAVAAAGDVAPDGAPRRASQRPPAGMLQRSLSYFNSQRDLTDFEVSQIHDAAANMGGAGEPLLPGPRVRRPTAVQKQAMSHAKVPADQLSQLLEETNFSKREIELFYKYFAFMASDDNACFVERGEFEALFEDAGLNQPLLRERLWHFFLLQQQQQLQSSQGVHINLQGLTALKIVKALNPLLRGTLEDVASFFFELYDLDNNGRLTDEEIINSYSDLTCRAISSGTHQLLPSRLRRPSFVGMVARSTRDRSSSSFATAPGSSRRPSPSLFDSAMRLSSKTWTTPAYLQDGLSKDAQIRISDWVNANKDADDQGLGKTAFVKAIVAQADLVAPPPKLFTPRNAFLICILSLYEVGGLFALLALAVLPDGFEERVGVDQEQIGVLNAVYFVAGMISPLVGGMLMDNYGPNNVTMLSNTIITLGATLQWLANNPSVYWLLLVSRFVIGFGLEITFFTTIEVYLNLFPDSFGFMVGVHTLMFNVTIFLAFTVIRAMADILSFPTALLVIAVLCTVSTGATILVDLVLRRARQQQEASKTSQSKRMSDMESDKTRITNTFASLSTVMTPHEPRGWKKLMLPLSFYLTIVGNKAIGYYFNTFSIFSVNFYSSNYQGVTLNMAATATGLAGLLAGFLAPIFGAIMDRYGYRARILAGASVVGVISFVVLFGVAQGYAVWIATAAFAVMNSVQDLGIVMIPLVVGASRAGIGYGVYGLLGNLVDATISYSAGVLLENGKDDIFLLFSAGIMVSGVASWIMVYYVESDQSFIEEPVSKIIETSSSDLHFASLIHVIFSEPERDTPKFPKDRSTMLMEILPALQEETDELTDRDSLNLSSTSQK